MKNVLNFQQFESNAQEDRVFYSVVDANTDELIAFFDEIDFANSFIEDEISSSGAQYDIEGQMREEGRNEEQEDWEDELETRLHEWAWETYDIMALDMEELIDYIKRLDKRRREWMFDASDSEHIDKDKIERIIRGKGMFGV